MSQAQELATLSPQLVAYMLDVWAGELLAEQILDFFDGEFSLEEVEGWVSWVLTAKVPDQWPAALIGVADLDCAQIVTLVDGSQLYLRWDPFCEAGVCRAL